MKKKRVALRRGIQIFFFTLILLIAVSHGLEKKGISLPLLNGASLHAVCPFGGVVTLYQLITTGTLIKKVHESSLILMAIVFVLALFLGPVFCGWVCPFGTFQSWLGALGKKIFKKKYNHFIPYKVDKWLRYARYILLVMVVVKAAMTGILSFQNIDPYYALFQAWTGEVAVSAFIMLGAVMILSLFVERPFCKYACPYGALLGLFNLFRISPLRRNTSSCINCKACDKRCPMNIEVSKSKVIRNHQCISCFECTSTDGVCPVKNTLAFDSKKLEEAAL